MTERPDAAKGRRRLLAVDDNRLILRVIEDFFVQAGFEVTTAENVAKAREALAVSDPDVIVSDILMPGVDGWTFFEHVRKRPRTALVPFVFLTVERELPQRLRGLHLGADDYMTKPFAVEELHARIERLLDRRESLRGEASGDGGALLSGSTEHLAIPDLLQILALNGKDGTVRVERPGEVGRIEFVSGRIVDAQAGAARGAKAMYRILGWAEASFRLMPRAGEPPEPTIAAGTANLLMDGLVSLDEWSRWKDQLPQPEARLELSREARHRVAGAGLKPAEFDLLARAKGGVTVAAAVDLSPHPDAEVAEAICTLLARGVLRAVAADRPAPARTP